MAHSKLRAELKRLADSPMVGNISKQMKVYEERVKRLAHDFELKSRDARERSRHHLDRFASQVKKTRGEVETKIVTMLNHESKRLNKSVNELVGYVKAITRSEKAKMEKAAAKSSQSAKSAKSSGPRKTSTRTRKPATKSASRAAAKSASPS